MRRRTRGRDFGAEDLRFPRDAMYSAMSSIPSGGPPGGTHTQELWYSLRGIDARLESVLSTDKCLCDACCARSQPLILLFLFSYFGLKNYHLSPGTPSLEFWFFVLFFPLNWAVKLENFRLNLRMNSLVVPYWAQKRARVAKKHPILWRIVRRSRRTLSFKFSCTFICFSFVHSIWTVVFGTSHKRCLENTKLIIPVI